MLKLFLIVSIQFYFCVSIAQIKPPKIVRDYNDIVGVFNYSDVDPGLSGDKNLKWGASNDGLNKYLTQLLEHEPDLKNKAKAFYSDIRVLDQRYASVTTKKVNAEDKGIKFLKASPITIHLKDEAGRGEFSDLKPGWLWDLALKHSGGDPKVAMRLIAICGEDDMAQASYDALISKEEDQQYNHASYERSMKRLGLEKEINDLDPRNERRINLLSQYQDLRTAEDEDFSRQRCPTRNSVLFLPKSLGEEVDISDDFKKKIVHSQSEGRNDPDSRIPAKYYHIIASAFVGCEMEELGHSPYLTTKMQETTAIGYRSIRLNAILRSNEFASRASEDERDAAFLLRNFSLEINGYTTGNYLTLPSTSSLFNLLILPHPFWSEVRYQKAKRKFESWMIDFSWTREQHRIGSEFGTTTCQKQNGH